MFTSLHRALGISSTNEFTTEMIDQLVDRQVAEAPDLDFKAAIPPVKALAASDVKKDLCAMANIGGGVIVYGVAEDDNNKEHAGYRTDVGKFDESQEQAYLSVAFGQIVPPLFGVKLHRVEDDLHNALVVVVPKSRQVPHMYFAEKSDKRTIAVPVRHGAHSVWLTEAEISRLYRERFIAEHDAKEALNSAYQRVTALRSEDGFWMAAVARPTYPTVASKPESQEIFQIGLKAREDQLRCKYYGGRATLIATNNLPKRGFRSWRFLDAKDDDFMYVEFHDDGAISMLMRIDEVSRDALVYSYSLPIVVGDLLAAMRQYSEWTGVREYDVRFGVEWDMKQPLVIKQEQNVMYSPESVVPIRRFVPVEATIDVSDPEVLLQHAHDLALDCLNQAGINRLAIFLIV
ncbi:AlbA family DNA-binding domain-containing protein [Corynebacterium durum]|jgi:hypothetical protein|uniref:AlbA family DNA-binding domain-containing protein n=1 Tax=Corynebacterium durum TaxID=61592 RepID=UPI0040417BAA